MRMQDRYVWGNGVYLSAGCQKGIGNEAWVRSNFVNVFAAQKLNYLQAIRFIWPHASLKHRRASKSEEL